MNISNIISRRNTRRGKNNWYQIVYEWENIFINGMNLTMFYENERFILFDKLNRKFRKYLHFNCNFFSNNLSNDNTLVFEITAYSYHNFYNRRGIVPYIIDYFLPKDSLNIFIRYYEQTELILISSREVYEYMIENRCPLRIEHLPLSIADQYMFSNVMYEKKYDLILCGRQSEKLIQYLVKYITSYNTTRQLQIIVVGNGLKKIFSQISNNSKCNFTFIQEIKGRDEYMRLMRESKILMYMTPNSDKNVSRTNGWSQVTPRFLEGIISQCHILCDYEDNADTDYFQLRKFSNPCNSYEIFLQQIDYYLNNEIDLNKYEKYIKNHLTSQRVKQLEDILKKY